MPRDLQPCGTVAAAMRHRRAGEAIDDACRIAEANQKAERDAARRQEVKERIEVVMHQEPEIDEDLDELKEARANLRYVRASMKVAPPQAIAALSKQRSELAAQIVRLEAAAKSKDPDGNQAERPLGVADIEARRAARLAAHQSASAV